MKLSIRQLNVLIENFLKEESALAAAEEVDPDKVEAEEAEEAEEEPEEEEEEEEEQEAEEEADEKEGEEAEEPEEAPAEPVAKITNIKLQPISIIAEHNYLYEAKVEVDVQILNDKVTANILKDKEVVGQITDPKDLIATLYTSIENLKGKTDRSSKEELKKRQDVFNKIAVKQGTKKPLDLDAERTQARLRDLQNKLKKNLSKYA